MTPWPRLSATVASVLLATSTLHAQTLGGDEDEFSEEMGEQDVAQDDTWGNQDDDAFGEDIDRDADEALEEDEDEATFAQDRDATPPAPAVGAAKNDELPASGVTVSYRPSSTARIAKGDFELLLPPLFGYRRSGPRTQLAIFPAFYMLEEKANQELVALTYYQRRGRDLGDVVFPLFWWFRGRDYHTWVVPPLWSHEDAHGYDYGIAPFYMRGQHDDSFYTLVPPLLTFDWGNKDEEYRLALIHWRMKQGRTDNWGVFPFAWIFDSPSEHVSLVPPFYFHWDNREKREVTTVVPPVYHHGDANESFWGIAPLFHYNEGKRSASLTIPPLLFHYGNSPEAFRLVTPLFLYFDEQDGQTLVTPLYQRFRGATEMDAVAPLFFSVRDPREQSSMLMATPLFWHFDSPSRVDTLAFPFALRLEERGRSTLWATPLAANETNYETGESTTWVFPTVQVSKWKDGDAVNLHPLFYWEQTKKHRHFVIAPLIWDFEEHSDVSHKRYTVGFPLFWRFEEDRVTNQLVLNTFYRHERIGSGSKWEFHFFPLFAFGESETGGHWWNVLYGLTGFERHGPYARASAFWIPFQVEGP